MMRRPKKLHLRYFLLAAAVLLCLLISHTRFSATAQDTAEPEDPSATLDGPYAVERVVDGDTIYIINDAAESEKVRFIGIDTPESVHADESKNSDAGLVASAFTKELLTGQSVWLEYDIDRQDQYGRTLAYVYIEEGETLVMVQDQLLYHGLAQTMTIQPNSKYAEHFAEIQREAQQAGHGFWANS